MGGGIFVMHWTSLSYLYIVLANIAATQACRVAGVSQEGTRHTLIERDPRAALAPFLREAPVFTAKALLEPRVVIDREGIEAKHSDKKRTRVAWSDIETCTCDITRAVAGSITGAEFVLQGAHERPLLKFRAPAGQAERVLAAISFYLRGEGSASGAAL